MKADELAALLNELFAASDEKVVVFSQWLRMHEVLIRRFEARGPSRRRTFTEVLRKPAAAAEAIVQANGSSPAVEASEAAVAPAATMARPAFPTDFLMEAADRSADDSGWAHLGTFGSYLQKIQPDLDSRLHGFKKLSDLVRGRDDLFLTEERIAPGGTSKVLYIRARKKR